MIIYAKAKNGQILNAIKSYYELTDEEQDRLVLPYGDTIDDYVNFQVRYNKKGEFLGVCGHEPVGIYGDETSETQKSTGIDTVDSMQLLFGNKRSKAYQAAKKRAGVTTKRVNAARQVFKNKK